jgi:hypothetical protein
MKFFDKEMNDIEEAQLKQHLKTCTKCSNEFTSLKEIFDYIEKDTDVEPPENFELQVMTRLKKETKMYKGTNGENIFAYDILLIAVSFIFVILFGGLLWEIIGSPIQFIQGVQTIIDSLKEFLQAAYSMGRGISIAIVGVTASVYRTYYYAYILLGIVLFITQRVFFKMIKGSNVRTATDNGGIQ